MSKSILRFMAWFIFTWFSSVTSADRIYTTKPKESVPANENPALCASFYQVMAMGFNNSASINGAKEADRYTKLYRQEKAAGLMTNSKEQWFNHMYAAMALVLVKIDNDYDRYRELEPEFQTRCHKQRFDSPDQPMRPLAPVDATDY